MADIVITEFMDDGPVERMRARYSVHWDTALCDQPDELIQQVTGAKALVVRNKTQVNQSLLDAAPDLKVVGRLGVGLDNIDMVACAARGVDVCPAVGANALSVAEYVIGAVFQLVRGVCAATQEVIDGGWPRAKYNAGGEVAGRVLGLIGYGGIGQMVAQRAQAFGMQVLAHDPMLGSDHPAWQLAERVDFAGVIDRSDVLSLHIPLTSETRNLISSDVIDDMKPGAIVIQTARGGVIDEIALANAIRRGHLGGAALDVFESEPPFEATVEAFKGVDNIVLTPHIAGLSEEANARVSAITADNVLRVLDAAK